MRTVYPLGVTMCAASIVVINGFGLLVSLFPVYVANFKSIGRIFTPVLGEHSHRMNELEIFEAKTKDYYSEFAMVREIEPV